MVELRGHGEHLIRRVMAPVTKDICNKRHRHARRAGLFGKAFGQNRIASRFKDHEMGGVVGQQDFGKVPACEVQQRDPVAQILHLVGEILGKAAFCLKSGDEDMFGLRQTFRFLMPFVTASQFVDADECRDLKLEPLVKLRAVDTSFLAHFLQAIGHQPRVVTHIVLQMVL